MWRTPEAHKYTAAKTKEALAVEDYFSYKQIIHMHNEKMHGLHFISGVLKFNILITFCWNNCTISIKM